MDRKTLLAAMKLGSDVAENEPELSTYFIETYDFGQVMKDEADLILGSKGSGKTAMCRMVLKDDHPELKIGDLTVLPAFNVGGSPFLSQVPADADEALFRRIWVAYILSLIGNYLLEQHSITDTKRELHTALARSDLLYPNAQSRSIWRRLVASAKGLKPEGTMEINESGMPVFSASIGAEAGQAAPSPASEPKWLEDDFDAEELIESLINTLERADRRVWVLLDRLDEAFADRLELETPALRGLLRAHLDVASVTQRIRLKIFLRLDIFDRITENSGFLNLDHFRTLRLHWTRQMIEDVVVRRLLSNPSFAEGFPISFDKMSYKDRMEILARFLPNKVHAYTGRAVNVMPGSVWCIQKTMDASGEPSPRNVLTLLRGAQRYALMGPRSVRDKHETESLIGFTDLDASWRRVSKVRLEDTLYAEFEELKPIVAKFRGTSQRARTKVLQKRLGLSGEALARTLDDLYKAGFLFRVNEDLYSVADLYTAALNIVPGTAAGPTDSKPNEVPQAPVTQGIVAARPFSDQNPGLKDDFQQGNSDYAAFLARSKQLLDVGAYSLSIQEAVKGESPPSENLVFAATVALRSEQPELAAMVLPKFGEPLANATELIAAKICLMLMIGQRSVCLDLLQRIDAYEDGPELVHRILLGLARSGSFELLGWKDLLRFRSLPSHWIWIITITAGSRLLSIAKTRSPEATSSEAAAIVELWWPGKTSAWTDEIGYLRTAVTEYVGSVSLGRRPPYLPYQMISIWFCLSRLSTSESYERDGLVIALAKHLSSLMNEDRDRFRDWADTDEFAGDVALHAGLL